jgi:hypothetical protein
MLKHFKRCQKAIHWKTAQTYPSHGKTLDQGWMKIASWHCFLLFTQKLSQVKKSVKNWYNLSQIDIYENGYEKTSNNFATPKRHHKM